LNQGRRTNCSDFLKTSTWCPRWREIRSQAIELGANWLFVGSEMAGQRAAIVMSLVQSAKLNSIDPWAYLRDALARIRSHPANRIEELLSHRRQPG
jgi:hypothetical protein